MDERENPSQGFTLLEHTADAGVRAWGRTREEMFINLSGGFYTLALDQTLIEGETELTYTVRGAGDEELLVGFIKELLYFLETRNFVADYLQLDFSQPGELHVKGIFGRIRATHVRHEIKSPTYHGLRVQREPGRWQVEMYFDL